jgi:hypothetical protein
MRFTILAVLCLSVVFTVLAGCPACAADDPASSKILPYSIRYPLISSTRYPSPAGDRYRSFFAVRRMLTEGVSRAQAEKTAVKVSRGLSAKALREEFNNTIEEARTWHSRYGTYGVLGLGEDVFTKKAADLRTRCRENDPRYDTYAAKPESKPRGHRY